MYVTLDGIRAAMFWWKRNKFYLCRVCVYSLSYQPAMRAFVILILQSSRLYIKFNNISQKTRFTTYNSLNLKCVF